MDRHTRFLARVKIETQADQLAEIKSQWGEQVASLKAEIGRYHERLEVVRDTAQQATAGEAEKWRETVALEHKRNAELQSERDNLAERLAALEATEKGPHRL
ncbi:hypothetical protein [Marinobacter gelidimuriae]|uniref:hypothetical protein n=1 Tax=Marinobacter gelidimuriae TaxID=2739064 RepID=UPI00036E6CE4|nr:hypothetical protein [Marinobacter gelidimuriae]